MRALLYMDGSTDLCWTTAIDSLTAKPFPALDGIGGLCFGPPRGRSNTPHDHPRRMPVDAMTTAFERK